MVLSAGIWTNDHDFLGAERGHLDQRHADRLADAPTVVTTLVGSQIQQHGDRLANLRQRGGAHIATGRDDALG
jgi:hypothetical protein